MISACNWRVRSLRIVLGLLLLQAPVRADDEKALLAAIVAHPNEDTPRLVYADFLEERGRRAHAAYIRAQIAAARVELTGDAPSLATHTVDELEALERATTTEGPAWAAILGGNYADLLRNRHVRITWDRGFPDVVTIAPNAWGDPRALELLNRLPIARKIEFLPLTSSHVTTTQFVEGFQTLHLPHNTSSLKLSIDGFSAAELKTIFGNISTPALELVRVTRGMHIEQLAESALAPKLRALKLHGQSNDALARVTSSERFSGLETLESHLHEVSLTPLMDLSKLPVLRGLTVRIDGFSSSASQLQQFIRSPGFRRLQRMTFESGASLDEEPLNRDIVTWITSLPEHALIEVRLLDNGGPVKRIPVNPAPLANQLNANLARLPSPVCFQFVDHFVQFSPLIQ